MEQYKLVLEGPKRLKWQTHEIKSIQDDEIIVKTIAGAISIGAELPQYNGSDVTDINPFYPRKTGYESYGEVIQVGNKVTNLNVGDKVISFYGHEKIGIVKENKVIRVPSYIKPKVALLTILSCDAAKGVLKLNPRQDEKVLITGMGVIGLLACYFLKCYVGVKHVDVVEPNRNRREFAKKFGAKNLYDSEEKIIDTYNYGFECSATNRGFHTLQKAINSNGAICILSDGNIEDLTLTADFYRKELQIIGSSDGYNYQKHADWFFNQIESTPWIEEIFQHEIHYTALEKCFEELSEGIITPLKVFVSYE
ncbi:zinc-binding dehydrogenase [Bacillus albus]|uniref:zinc-binding dehydrogenase n=1 Tax=Bacillus cereus group TaxID=86661 RepID=UPI0022E480D9|nr:MULTISPECIES: zinc-binding dehydrogenase [Bacillus cereus group]MDA2025963.1 alcohol dehydrogenase catalytic domain-containing protein [Bacillus cereus group sp. Bcc03]MDA2215741.1 alcohol dehydrogenase catalytic domain-containing protein [Bacillus cereus group sp. Bc228]MDA2225883.1 alcohol dehydrogenase catalytic domain-containing protein [Bacillus cereus group sp. Bc227]MDA2260067.1 alcohol dehydrogenase catalytic domain-containing protein [Bacillus cereus group sp. Bc200]MDA2320219.1 al